MAVMDIDGRQTFTQNFACLLLRDAFYLLQQPPGCICDGLHRVVPGIDDELNVTLGEACDALRTAAGQYVGNALLDRRGSHTSSAWSGVGAPGPVAPPSSTLGLLSISSTCVIFAAD